IDLGGPEPTSNYAASINWGDGSPASAGTINYDSAQKLFLVSGTHAYPFLGSYSVHVALTHEITITASTSSTVTVRFPLAGGGLPISGTQGAPLSAIPVALFFDPNGAQP